MPGKTTVPCTQEQYEILINTIFNGIGKLKPNPRIATALEVQANTGLRIGDILLLRLSLIIKDGKRYRFNMIEEKTGKKRNFTIPKAVYEFIVEYVHMAGIKDDEVIFPLTERGVQKHLQAVCKELGEGFENIGTHSFRKYFGTEIYYANNCDIELVRRLYQHSSVATTQRYLGISEVKVETALENHVKLVNRAK